MESTCHTAAAGWLSNHMEARAFPPSQTFTSFNSASVKAGGGLAQSRCHHAHHSARSATAGVWRGGGT